MLQGAMWSPAADLDHHEVRLARDFPRDCRCFTGSIRIVPEPLVVYRTAPASANVRSMTHRLELYGQIIDRHTPAFTQHAREALLALEATAMRRLGDWERLVSANRSLDVGEVTYGDGGLAAAVRIATTRQTAPRTDAQL